MAKLVELVTHLKNGSEVKYLVSDDAGNTGKQLVIQANKNIKTYELKEVTSKFAPNQILVKRVGKDLVIHMDVDGKAGESSEAPDIILKDYYSDNFGQLVGVAEDGNIYPYIPQEGEMTLLSQNMVENAFSYQSLGSYNGVVGSDFNLSSLGLGVLLLGGLGGGGGGSNNNSNNAPDAVDDGTALTPAIIIDENTTATNIDVLGNDIDADTGDILSVTSAGSPNGSVVINADGTLNFTPTSDFSGDTTITYTISDGNGGTDTATVYISVNHTGIFNTNPIATPSTSGGNEDTSIAVELSGTDVDGIIDYITVINLPSASEGVLYYSDGTTPVSTSTPLTPTEAASLMFIPAANFNGEVTITFTVTDNLGATSASANEVITVTPVNDVPTITVTATNNFTEDSGASVGDVVATYTTYDEEGNLVSVTLSDTTNYAIDPATGAVTLTAAGAAIVNRGADLPAFTLTPNDGTANGTPANVDPAVTPIDDGLTIDVTPVATLTEDTAVAGTTVATTTGSDVDGGTITYTISDTTNYAIDPATGAVTLTAAGAAIVNKGDDLPSFTVSATSTSGNTGNDNATPPATTDVDDGLIIDVTPVATLTEDTAVAGTPIATTTGSDVDGGTITYTISDTTNYAIDPATGAVTLTAAGAAIVNKGDDLPSFTVSATSTSGNTGNDNATPPATTDVDDGLIIDVTPVATLTEDTAVAGTPIATTTGSDVDGGTITYTISDTTNYAIDPATGAVTLTAAGAAIVNKGDDLPSFTVSATSTSGNTGNDNATPPATTDVDDGLTIDVTPVATLTEDTAVAGTPIATTTGSDVDGGTITYTISDTTNYAIDPATGAVTLTAAGAAIVNKGDDLPSFTVSATSTSGNTGNDNATPPATTDVDDGLIIDVTPVATLTEDTAVAGTPIATTTGSDVDGGTITYTISDTTNYAIDPATGAVTLTAAGAAIVNKGDDLPSFTVSATSTSGNSGNDNATPPATTDVDDGLIIDVTPVATLTEDTAVAGTPIATTTGSDVDGGTITYTISDTTNYAIDPATGAVTLTAAGADLVNRGDDLPSFTVSATSTSGNSGNDNATPPATTDVDDGLIIDVTPVATLTEDTAVAGTPIATTTGSDVDGGTITYTISDTTNYAIDPATGAVTLTAAGAAIVNKGDDLPSFTVSATSTSGNTGNDNATPPATTDVDDGLIIDVTPVATLTEDTAVAGTPIATTTGSDVDGGTITYTISDTTNYAIDPATGAVTLTAAGAAIVNKGDDLPSFTVSATSTSGNSGNDNATPPATTDVDDGLIIDVTPVATLTEDTAVAGTPIATTTGSDVDGGTITYTISDTTNYAIDPATGAVTLTAAGAAIVNKGDDLPSFTVSATSTSGNTGNDNATPPATTDVDDGLIIDVTPVATLTEDTAVAGTPIATTTGSDVDGGTITYTISDTTNYAIDPATGAVTLTAAGAAIVNKGDDLPSFTVSATSTSGNTGNDNATPPATTDVDDGLTIDVTPVATLTEDTAVAGTTVATTTGSDVDGGTITYTISDTTNYAIDPATGAVTLTAAGAAIVNKGDDLPSFTVSATSTSGNSGNDNATPPATTDVDDGLIIDVTPVATLTEDTAVAGATVATTTGSDVDGGTITYTISDTTNYAIDPATGAVTLTAAGADLVNRGDDLPSFTVSATSTSGNTGNDNATPPATTDVDDGLTIDVTPVATLTEDTAVAGTPIATTTGSDVDGGTITYTISDTTNYAIDPATGAVTLTAAGAAIVNKGDDLPSFTVSATSTSGNSGNDNATPPATTDVDDGLIIDVTPVATLTEDTAVAGTPIATTTGSDVDGGTITYTISDTTNYAIDPATGAVTLTAAGADLVNRGDDLPSFTVSATSTSGNSGNDNATPPATTDVDDGLIIDVTPVATLTEDTAVAGTTVATTTGSDVDGGTITYTISDTTNYAIDPATGAVTLTAAGAAIVNKGDDLPSFTVSATSTSGNTGNDNATPPATTDVDDGLIIDVTPVATLTEDTAVAGTTVATTTGSDVDGGTITYTISDTTNYAIDPATGAVTLTAAGAAIVNKGDDLPSFTVSATSTSGNTGNDNATPPATTDVDDGLIIDVTPVATLTEDTAVAGTPIATTTGSDVDGGTITYTISDTTNYAIDPATGAVTLTAAGAAIVNKGDDLPSFTVSATSTSGNSGNDNATPPATTDVDDGLTIDVTPVATLTEDTAVAGTPIATTTGSDVDGGTITYTISDTTNYAIDPATGAVTLTAAGAAIVNRGDDLPSFTVSATSTSGNTGNDNATPPATTDVDDGLTIDVTPVATLTEDTAVAGTPIATTTGSDVDGGTITYTISDTTNYAIDPATGAVTLTAAGAAIVNRGDDLPSFTVSATSTSGNSGNDNATPPATTDVNDGLTIDVTPVATLTEDAVTAGTPVATTTGSDVDGGTITYAISDTTNYAINPATGAVTLTAAGAAIVNRGDDLPSFTVSATSTSGNSGNDNATPPATTDVNDGLTIDVTPVATLTEDAVTAGTPVATTTGSDVDGGTITYAISDTTNYAINPATGAVTLTAAGAAIVNAGNDLPSFTVSATSTSGNSGNDNATPPATTDVDDGLTIDVTPVATLTEDTAVAGTPIATTTGSDVDGGTITYTISDTTNYAIDPATGAVTLTAAGAAIVNRGDDLPSFTVTGTSTSGNSGNDNATPPATTDVDDGLTIDVTPVATLTEDTAVAGTPIATTTGSDVDGGTITYTISDTTNYAIDPATGAVTLTAAGAAIVNRGDDLPSFTVSATSTSGNTGNDNATPPATTDVDDGLTIDVTPVATLTEDTAVAGTPIATTTGSDVDGGTITYTISDTTNYAIDPATGAVTLTAAGAAIVNRGDDLPSFTVSATSTSGNTGNDNATPPATTDVDDGLTIDVTPVATLTEDTAVAGTPIATTTGSDVDGGTITYTISDTTNYAIDPATGAVTLTAAGAAIVNRGDDLPSFTVSATSTSGNTGNDNATPPATTDVDDGLTIDVTPVATLTEDAVTAGTPVATTTGSDVDGGTITYAISDTTNYAINPATGAVTLTAAGAAIVNRGDDLPSFTVSATSTSGNTGNDNATPPATTDVNDGLTIDVTPVATLTEDAVTAGTPVATTTGSDVDGGTITYAISDTTNYAIDPATGAVTLTAAGAAIVNAGNDLPSFTVTGTSTSGNSGNDNATPPATTDVNDGLTIDVTPVATLTEDAVTAGTPVATTTGSDVDGGTITYAISDTTNYAINPATGAVTLTAAGAAIVNRGDDLPSFTVSATSTSGNTGNDNATPPATTDVDDGLTIDVTPVATLTEDTAVAGTPIATTTGSDVDGGTITYTISDTTNYAIDPATGAVTLTAAGAAIVNRGDDLPSFTVSATSTSGNTGNDNATPPATTDVDDGLTIDVTPVATLTEDTAVAGTPIATTTGSDVDGGTITYTISDTTNYAINPATGAVTLTAAGAAIVNAGNDLPSFTVTGTSTSGNTGNDNATPPATTDVNDGLTIDVTPVATLTEDAVTAGTPVATTTGSDVDGGTITYAISDTTNYAINPATGAVTLTAAGAAIVNAGNDLPSFTVSATSTSGNTGNDNATPPATTDVDDAPTITGNTTGTGNEDTAITGTLSVTDVDGMTDGTYFTVTGTASHGTASINTATGVWSYTPTADYNGSDSFVVTITDDQGFTTTQTINLTVSPVADIVNNTATTNEDTAVTTSVLTNDTFEGTPTITATTNGAHGTVVNNGNGTVTYTPATNWYGTDTYTYTVTSGGVTETATVSVTVNPVNDAPTITGNTTGTGNEDTAITGTLSVTDVDGMTDGTYFTVTGTASHGTASINTATGVWSYTPTADYNGSDSFVVTITDDQGFTTTQTINLTVSPVADIVNNTATTNEDTAVTTSVLTNDTFEGTPTITATTNGAHGTVVNNGNGTVTYTPATNWYGTDTYTYTVTSGGVTETATVSVTVNPVNDAPTITGNTTGTGNEDTAITGTLSVTDVDGMTDGTYFTVTGTASHGTASINTATGVWSYTPTADYNGSDSFVVTITDDQGFTTTQTINLTVSPVADIVNNTATTNEDTAVTTSVLTNDTFEGTPTITATTNGAHGTVVNNGNGTVTYTPATNWYGTDTYTYTVTSGGVTETATVSVTVNPVNDAPTITGNTTGTGNEDTAITGTLSVTDVDGMTDGTYFTVTGTASHGTASINTATGVWSYTPTADYNGSDSFVVTITDDQGFTTTQTINLTVSPVADIVNNTATTNEDTAVTTSVLTNDTFEGTPTITATTNGAHGTVVNNGNGTVTYTPATNWYGTDTYTYTVTSGGVTETATVSVTVNPVNDAPTITGNTTGTGNEDTAITGTLSVTDVDGMTDGTYFTVTGTASHGTASINTATGVWSYTPTADYNGSDSFVVTITDDQGFTTTQTINLTVSPVADIVNNTATTNEDTAVTTSVLTNDTFEGTPTITATTNGAHGTVVNNGNGTVTYTPATNWYGTDTYTYTVTSGGVTETATVSVTVNPVNDAPTITGNTTGTGNEDTAITGTLSVTDVDGMTDGTYFTVTGTASHGTASINTATGVWSYTPTADYNGSDSFVVTITDDQGFTTTQTINLTVSPVADIVNNTATTNEDTAVTTSVLTNDTFEGTPTITATTNGAHGTVVNNGNGTVTYTPATNWYGTDTYTYTVTSGGVTETATVSVTVNPVNDAPTITGNTTGTGNEDTAITGTLSVTDVDGMTDGTYFTVTGTASHGTASINTATGVWSYTPTADYNGSDSFVVTITDDQGFTTTQTINLTVSPVADIVNNTATTNEDTAVTTSVLTNDTFEGTPTITATTNGAHGTVVNNGNGTVTYTPATNWYGTDTYTYTVTSGGVTETATVSVTVNPVNDAPTSTNDSITILEDMNNTTGVYTFTNGDFGTYSDIEGSALSSIKINSLPTNGIIYLSGVAITAGAVISIANITAGNLTFNPTDNSDADSSFTFNVNDGTDWSSASYTTDINITAVADIPILIPPTQIYNLIPGTTSISTTSAITQANLESTLGMTTGTLDGFNPPVGVSNDPGTVNVIDGMLTGYNYSLQSGISVAFNWQFINGETSANDINSGFNDLVILSVVDPNGVRQNILISSSEQVGAGNSSSGTYTFSPTIAGEYQFSWLVLNGSDSNMESSVNINGVNFVMNGINYSEPIAIPISTALTDVDGSESLSITISGVPSGAAFSAGTNLGGGVWSFTSSELDGLNFLPASGYTGTLNLTLTATATESSNSDTASITQSLIIDVATTTNSIMGTQANNILAGTTANDHIQGYTGNDTLNGNDGNDMLYGGAGTDTLNGGNGNDSLYGEAGTDTLNGGNGNDSYWGGAGNDTITLTETIAATDVIYWTYTDGGVDGIPATDTLTGFATTGTTHDALNVNDLLIGENGSSTDIGNLLNYIQIDTGVNSTIHLSTDGQFTTNGSNVATTQNQAIVLNGVDLSTYGSTDEAIIKAMINSGVLVV